MASYERKLALVGCLFAVSAVEGNISVAEESEIQRIARELKIDHGEVVKLRLAYRNYLPGLSARPPASDTYAQFVSLARMRCVGLSAIGFGVPRTVTLATGQAPRLAGARAG